VASEAPGQGPATADWSTSIHDTGREPSRTGCIAGRPACVERSIPSDPDGRRVVPKPGDDSKNGRARCSRQPSPGTCAQRRSPSFSRCPQRRSAAGRRRACCPTSAPWAATDATPTGRSGRCWKPCPRHPRPASRAPGLTAPGPLLSMARWPFGIVLRLIGVVSDRGTADFLRARDNPGDYVTRANARKRLLTCVVGWPSLAAAVRGFPVVRGPSAALVGSWETQPQPTAPTDEKP
jgi:hypothetical protein